jgi:TolA-binding protein
VEFFAATAGEVPRAEPASSVRGLEGKVETLLREANHLELQEQTEEAVARYEQILAKYPGTNYARESERRLARIRTKMDM